MRLYQKILATLITSTPLLLAAPASQAGGLSFSFNYHGFSHYSGHKFHGYTPGGIYYSPYRYFHYKPHYRYHSPRYRGHYGHYNKYYSRGHGYNYHGIHRFKKHGTGHFKQPHHLGHSLNRRHRH